MARRLTPVGLRCHMHAMMCDAIEQSALQHGLDRMDTPAPICTLWHDHHARDLHRCH